MGSSRQEGRWAVADSLAGSSRKEGRWVGRQSECQAACSPRTGLHTRLPTSMTLHALPLSALCSQPPT